MGFGKLVVIGGVGLGLAALFLHSKDAGASVPAGWAPPAGAVRLNFPSNGPGTIGLTVADWAADPGQPPGRFTLIWDPNDPHSFVALFWPAATPTVPAVMQVGSTPNSQLILSTVPNLVASMQAKGLH